MTREWPENLEDFIENVESRFFRTNMDTGANANALMIWNMLRDFAGLDELTHDDLRMRQVNDPQASVSSIDEVVWFEDWYKRYDANRWGAENSVARDLLFAERYYAPDEAKFGMGARVRVINQSDRRNGRVGVIVDVKSYGTLPFGVTFEDKTGGSAVFNETELEVVRDYQNRLGR